MSPLRPHGGGRPPVTMGLTTVLDSFGVKHLRLQLPTGYVFIPPADARRLAALLLNAADEADSA